VFWFLFGWRVVAIAVRLASALNLSCAHFAACKSGRRGFLAWDTSVSMYEGARVHGGQCGDGRCSLPSSLKRTRIWDDSKFSRRERANVAAATS
jgi:hypothetical protein